MLILALRVGDPMLEQRMAGESMFAGRRGRLANVIGLDGTLGDDSVRTLLQGFPNQEFELSSLVAATREAGAIVPFDPKRRAAKMLAQPGHRLDWSGLVTQVDAGKLL